MLYLVKALSWFYIALAYLYPYYADLGLSFQSYLSLIAIFSAGVVVFEFPTGYIGDRIGHHRSIQIGLFFSTLGWMVLYLSSTFGWFAIAELCMALGMALVSGSDSALLYDSIEESGGSYTGAENKIHSITSFAEAFGGIAGMLLVVHGVSMLIALQWVLLLCAACVSLLLRPVRDNTFSEVGFLRDMQRVLLHAVHNTYLGSLILFSATTSAATFTALWFIQGLLGELHVPLWVYGAIWFAQNAFLGVMSLYAERCETFLGSTRSLTLLAVAPALVYGVVALMPLSYSTIALFLVFFFVRALLNSYTKARIQAHALSDRRASIFSIQGLLFRLIFALVGPLVGFIATAYSLQYALLFSAILFLLLGIVPAHALLRAGYRVH